MPRHLRRLPGRPRRRGAGRRRRSCVACGRRRWSRLAPAGRARGALPARLVDGAAARRRHDGGRSRSAASPPASALSSLAAGRAGSRAALRSGLPIELAAVAARLAAVHRRGALRDPRHRAQPGHVPAPVRRRPARRRRQRAADHARAIRSARTRSSSRVSRARAEHRAGLRRAHAGDRGRRLPRAARRCSSGSAPGGASPGRCCVGLRLPGRRLPGPGRVQGDDAGAVRARLRDRRSASCAARAGRERGAGPRGAARRCRSRCSRSAASTPTAFPGLSGSAGALGVWAAVELGAGARARRPSARAAAARAARRRRRSVAIGVLVRRVAPEVGRMVDFASFETFNPAGAGLGNLFNRLSPLEALGIWPSGDFRVEPGDGAIPAIAFYLGAALARRRRSPSGSPGGCAAASGRCPRRSPRRRCCGSTRCSAGTPVPGGEGAGADRAPLVALISVRGACSPSRRSGGLVAVAFLRRRAAARACSRSPTGRWGRAATRRALAELRDAARAGLDARRRARRAARRPARGRLPRLGAARQPDLRRVRADGRARRRRGSRATLAVGLDATARSCPTGELREPGAAGARAGPCPLIPDAARADPGAGG